MTIASGHAVHRRSLAAIGYQLARATSQFAVCRRTNVSDKIFNVRCGDTRWVRRYLSRVVVDGNAMVIAEMIESAARINDGEVVESFSNP